MVVLLITLLTADVVGAPAPPRPVLDYLDVDVRWTGAPETIEIKSAVRGKFDSKRMLPRFRGRFTLIVAHGKDSLAEQHFDFPLMADAETDDFTPEAQRAGKALRKGVMSAATMVRVGLVEGADALIVYDNQTRRSVRVELKEVLKEKK
jgi:hypothetical protein